MTPEPLRPEDLRFTTLAAPGLDEDDLFVALHGLPGALLWGDAMPSAFPPGEPTWDEDAERARRHEELLRRWRPLAD